MQSWIPLVPERASSFAWKVDALYFYLSGVTLFFTLLISATLIFFVIRYRRRSPYEIPRPVAGSHKLETIWTVIPFAIAMTMFVWGATVYFEQYKPPENAIEVYVVGKQWMWKLQHATGQREINELHVPVGRKIKLIMTTEDVIHDFFVPAFRTKADVVPGKYQTIWFEPTKPGRYHLFCAEYCGMNHSGMTGSIIVMEPREFDDWLSGPGPRHSRHRRPPVSSCIKRSAARRVMGRKEKVGVVQPSPAFLEKKRNCKPGSRCGSMKVTFANRLLIRRRNWWSGLDQSCRPFKARSARISWCS